MKSSVLGGERMTTVYCDVSYCEYYDDGFFSKEKIEIKDFNCVSNRICFEEDTEKESE